MPVSLRACSGREPAEATARTTNDPLFSCRAARSPNPERLAQPKLPRSVGKYLHIHGGNRNAENRRFHPPPQREIIQQSLDEIAAEVGTALREAHLDFPVFLTVPNSGNSLATMATPLDPSYGDLSMRPPSFVASLDSD